MLTNPEGYTRAMTVSRRPIALALVLAVFVTALAPLLGALRMAGAGEAEPLCHQAGLQVDATSAPLPAQPGEAPARKTHCPLCIMVFFASFAKPVEFVPPLLHVGVAALTFPDDAVRHRIATASFLSRGPPIPAPLP